MTSAVGSSGGLLGAFHPITSALPIALNVRQVDAYMGMLGKHIIGSTTDDDESDKKQGKECPLDFL